MTLPTMMQPIEAQYLRTGDIIIMPLTGRYVVTSLSAIDAYGTITVWTDGPSGGIVCGFHDKLPVQVTDIMAVLSAD